MIIERLFYSVKCDHCGKTLDKNAEGDEVENDSDNTNFEMDKDAALAVAEFNGWWMLDNSHYCHECADMMQEQLDYEYQLEYKRLGLPQE